MHISLGCSHSMCLSAGFLLDNTGGKKQNTICVSDTLSVQANWFGNTPHSVILHSPGDSHQFRTVWNKLKLRFHQTFRTNLAKIRSQLCNEEAVGESWISAILTWYAQLGRDATRRWQAESTRSQEVPLVRWGTMRWQHRFACPHASLGIQKGGSRKSTRNSRCWLIDYGV